MQNLLWQTWIQVIGYHVVIEGSMLVALDGEQSMELRAGEIVLFPGNDNHTMGSASGLTPVSAYHLIQQSPDGGPIKIRYGGGREATSIVCGFLGTQDAYNPLLKTLPRMLKLDISKAASRGWIESSVRFAAEELVRGRLASSSVMSRLSEVLLVEAVREYSSTLADWEQGWLKGLNDPNTGRALALIHADIAAPWSADTLAKEVALSRSAFMERFSALIGLPQSAISLSGGLRRPNGICSKSRMGISQIAHAVGYGVRGGFRRAFRREFEMSPAEWRDRQAKQ